MNLSIKKISLFMSGLFVLSPLAFASDDLGLRTLNNVKEIPLASNTDGYEYFYSNVFVSNGRGICLLSVPRFEERAVQITNFSVGF